VLRAVLPLVVLSLALGCGGEAEDGSGPGPEGECLARLVWDDVTYYSAGRLDDQLALGKQLGQGHIPRCSGAPGPALNVVRIRGVDPAVAVAAEGEGDPPYAWLAPGYVPESPRHPLHDAIYGSPSQPDAEAGFRCEAPLSLRARALNTPAFDFTSLQVAADDEEFESFLRADDVDGIVSFDADTTVEGHDRDGIPYVRAGDEFSLILRECVGSEVEPGLVGLRRLVVKRLGP